MADDEDDAWPRSVTRDPVTGRVYYVNDAYERPGLIARRQSGV